MLSSLKARGSPQKPGSGVSFQACAAGRACTKHSCALPTPPVSIPARGTAALHMMGRYEVLQGPGATIKAYSIIN